jgi:photosystem II CP43 chlorophyll apoprotein
MNTPLNSSDLSLLWINNLPIYRKGLSPFSRGLEIGMAHGYFLFGPFAILGPLRNTDLADLAGLLSACGLVVILALGLSLYGRATFVSNKPVGGAGGALFAYLLVSNGDLLLTL